MAANAADASNGIGGIASIMAANAVFTSAGIASIDSSVMEDEAELRRRASLRREPRFKQ